jgi:hypothetical protein
MYVRSYRALYYSFVKFTLSRAGVDCLLRRNLLVTCAIGEICVAGGNKMGTREIESPLRCLLNA